MTILKKVNIADAFKSVGEFWSPRVGGDIGNFQIKLAKFRGEFHWHHHDNEDELFLVVCGSLLMKLKPGNGGDILVGSGEFIIVPRGVAHCPMALTPEVDCLLFEPKSTLNTGNEINDWTRLELPRLA